MVTIPPSSLVFEGHLLILWLQSSKWKWCLFVLATCDQSQWKVSLKWSENFCIEFALHFWSSVYDAELCCLVLALYVGSRCFIFVSCTIDFFRDYLSVYCMLSFKCMHSAGNCEWTLTWKIMWLYNCTSKTLVMSYQHLAILWNSAMD